MSRTLPPRAAALLRVVGLGTPSMTRLPSLNWSSARSRKWLIMGRRSIQGAKRGAARYYASMQRLERPWPSDHFQRGIAAPPQKGAPWALQRHPYLQLRPATQLRSSRRRRRSRTQTKPPCNACDQTQPSPMPRNRVPGATPSRNTLTFPRKHEGLGFQYCRSTYGVHEMSLHVITRIYVFYNVRSSAITLETRYKSERSR